MILTPKEYTYSLKIKILAVGLLEHNKEFVLRNRVLEDHLLPVREITGNRVISEAMIT